MISRWNHGLGRLLWSRLLQAGLVAWLVGTLTFIITRTLPGDMAYRIAAGRYGHDMVDGAAAEAGDRIGRAVHFQFVIQIDLGASYGLTGMRYLPRQDKDANGTVALGWASPANAGGVTPTPSQTYEVVILRRRTT